jgi:hypothetical protein
MKIYNSESLTVADRDYSLPEKDLLFKGGSISQAKK